MKQYATPIILVAIVAVIALAIITMINSSPESGVSMGYIKNIYDRGGKQYIDLDNIQWLSQSEGSCATQAGQGIPQCNPNGFLIVNDDSEATSYEVTPGVLITRTSLTNPESNNQTIIDVATFAALDKTHFDSTPYRIELRKGVVMSITEHSIP